MEGSPMNRLPHDTLQLIFSSLPLRDIIACRSVCKSFNQMLTSSSFMELISSRPPLHLLALRPPHHHHHHHHHRCEASFHPFLHVYDLYHSKWLRFSLDFLPFRSPHPVASAGGLVYFWGDSTNSTESNKSLVVSNPLTRQYRVLPQLGSAWSRHGSVLVDSVNRVMVLTELAALYFSGSSNKWLKFSSNLPSKPRSPILIANSVYALCDVGSPWRSRWKLFTCSLNSSGDHHHNWVCLEKNGWGDTFDTVKRPRLVRGTGCTKILMIGGLKSTLALNPACSTMLILRLDLDSLEWEEAARMPVDMYRCFQESTKFKVFGGGDKVCFSAKRVGRLALWDSAEGWRWIDEMPGNGDGLSRGFVFEAQLNAFP